MHNQKRSTPESNPGALSPYDKDGPPIRLRVPRVYPWLNAFRTEAEAIWRTGQAQSVLCWRTAGSRRVSTLSGDLNSFHCSVVLQCQHSFVKGYRRVMISESRAGNLAGIIINKCSNIKSVSAYQNPERTSSCRRFLQALCSKRKKMIKSSALGPCIHRRWKNSGYFSREWMNILGKSQQSFR